MERTHDDTWDLATSVGATATMVAAGRARATRAAQPLIDDPFAEPLVRAVGIDFFTRWATGELAAADVDLPGTPWGMQPMTDLLAARTRFFDAFLTALSELGIRQVVILASGLDARGYRLMWPSDTVIYEIDQPDVLSFKAATLAELNATPTADVRTVPVDLRHDWPTALREAGFDVAVGEERLEKAIAQGCGLARGLGRLPKFGDWQAARRADTSLLTEWQVYRMFEARRGAWATFQFLVRERLLD
ncbi:MAG: hypothetical protein QOG79_4126, partial [Mycobacterium sp.]|nr:hypothetical protein [Mycobacterium sp.]